MHAQTDCYVLQIGYSCGEVINDGKTIVMGQARVSEKYQNQEVINKVGPFN